MNPLRRDMPDVKSFVPADGGKPVRYIISTYYDGLQADVERLQAEVDRLKTEIAATRGLRKESNDA